MKRARGWLTDRIADHSGREIPYCLLVDLDVLPTNLEVKLIKSGDLVRVLLMKEGTKVFRSRSEFVALRRECHLYEVYVGAKELAHFSEHEPAKTKHCLQCNHLVGHDPKDSNFRCQHCKAPAY